MSHGESEPQPATAAPAGRVVLFVCPHGAGKSRIAQAYFDALHIGGWRAVSAGTQPQATVSAHAARLLAGTPAGDTLDTGLPRPVSAVADPDLVVAIDCAEPPAPGAVLWRLRHQTFDTALRDEIHDLVTRLAAGLQRGAAPDREEA
jgi:protein-tyrosine-phosphatase